VIQSEPKPTKVVRSRSASKKMIISSEKRVMLQLLH
jgi:hypothetical protein